MNSCSFLVGTLLALRDHHYHDAGTNEHETTSLTSQLAARKRNNCAWQQTQLTNYYHENPTYTCRLMSILYRQDNFNHTATQQERMKTSKQLPVL